MLEAMKEVPKRNTRFEICGRVRDLSIQLCDRHVTLTEILVYFLVLNLFFPSNRST